MKKLLFSFFVIVISTFSLIAQVDRQQVLIEAGTGTGCQFCPGVSVTLHELYEAGDPVAAVKYHNYNSSDPFNTPEAAARTSYYGITGYPHTQFDGEWDEHSGGSTGASLYSTFLPKVTARMAIQTDFTIEIFGDNVGNNYDIIVRINEVSDYSGSNLKVRFALTETDIPYNWQNQSMITYCERTMAPDAEGTPLTISTGQEVDVNLNFTFDNSWVASNCELVAWVQDDDNKFVLVSTSVMLPALESDVALALFSANTTTTCEGGGVNFTDESAGSIISWNWTFEGGTPATSTEQNPSVIYATEGSYDVTLQVTDGETTSILTNDNMIDAIVAPIQPSTPEGETVGCWNTINVYTTEVVPHTDTYIWEVVPAEAGIIIGDGPEGTFTADDSWTGSYTISVRADNSCGIGTWSTPLNCTLNFTPTGFFLSDGGGICAGGPGLEITQNGSEVGVDYELYRDNVYTNTTIAGTGSTISFGNQTEAGTYTVIGVAASCDLLMWGTPWLYYEETPAQPNNPEGPATACNNVTSTYTIPAVSNATSIVWGLSPADAGTIIGSEFEAEIVWEVDFVGTATLTAQGVNDCGEGPVSAGTDISVDAIPMPEVSGLTLVCNDEQADYSVEDVTGNTYVWEVVGGDIVSGAGTSSVSILWGNPGDGSLSITETTVNDCAGISENYSVTIDDCIGISESIADGGISLYPNPATSNVEIAFNEKLGAKYTMVIYNSLGQVMNNTKGIVNNRIQNISLNVSEYKTGIYIVNITSDKGLNVRTTFEKTR